MEETRYLPLKSFRNDTKDEELNRFSHLEEV